jgi:ligand-binding SRPBCC domain-containing protein
MKTHVFRREVWLPRPPADVFPFFADASNLDVITPPWLSFRTLTQGEVAMKAGALIDYRLRVHGVPVRWQSEITVWDPPRRFVDEQRRGPYRLWVHEHRFVEKDGGTLAVDDVRYAVPGGALVNALFVARDIERIFEFRYCKLQELFSPGPHPR